MTLKIVTRDGHVTVDSGHFFRAFPAVDITDCAGEPDLNLGACHKYATAPVLLTLCDLAGIECTPESTPFDANTTDAPRALILADYMGASLAAFGARVRKSVAAYAEWGLCHAASDAWMEVVALSPALDAELRSAPGILTLADIATHWDDVKDDLLGARHLLTLWSPNKFPDGAYAKFVTFVLTQHGGDPQLFKALVQQHTNTIVKSDDFTRLIVAVFASAALYERLPVKALRDIRGVEVGSVVIEMKVPDAGILAIDEMLTGNKKPGVGYWLIRAPVFDDWGVAAWLRLFPDGDRRVAFKILLEVHNIAGVNALLLAGDVGDRLWDDALRLVCRGHLTTGRPVRLLQAFDFVVAKGARYGIDDDELCRVAGTLMTRRGGDDFNQQRAAVARKLLSHMIDGSWEAVRIAASMEDEPLTRALLDTLP